MGKLKFTLSNLWFWVAMLAIVFLTENLSLLTNNLQQGFNPATLGVLSVGCLGCLVLYFLIKFLHLSYGNLTKISFKLQAHPIAKFINVLVYNYMNNCDDSSYL